MSACKRCEETETQIALAKCALDDLLAWAITAPIDDDLLQEFWGAIELLEQAVFLTSDQPSRAYSHIQQRARHAN